MWHLKIGPKSKKLLECMENDAKAGKTQVWNELRPKLIHKHISLNKGLLKKWCYPKQWPLHLWYWVHLYPKKGPNRAKSYYCFHWKLKGDRTLRLIYLDNLITIFDFAHLQVVNWGSKLDQKLKTLGDLKILLKNTSLWKNIVSSW